MPAPWRSPIGLAMAAALIGLTACSRAASTSGAANRSTSPQQRTVIRSVHVVSIGRGVELRRTQRVGGRPMFVDVQLRAGPPTLSRLSLSRGYGYPPANGLYLTFRLSISNLGQVPVIVGPAQFSLDVGGGERHVTSYDGNAPYDGSRVQLDKAVLLPGKSVNKPLTFDVARSSGQLIYAPEGKPAIRWRF